MEFPVHIDSGWCGPKTAVIKNPDQYTNAYHINFRGSSDIEVRRGGPKGPTIGRVTYHSWRNYTDVLFENNQSSKLARESTFSKTETLVLPAAPKRSQFF